jgi:hypothetical protein
MKFVNGRVIYSLLFFGLLMVLLYVSKPKQMFSSDGSIKPYGVGEGKTVISLGVLTVLSAICSFYVFALLDVIFA